MRYALDTIILKTRPEVKGPSDPKVVCDTPPSQDAYTHQIWIIPTTKNTRYAADTISL